MTRHTTFHMMSVAGLFALVSGLFLVLSPSAGATPPDQDGEHKVTICHRTNAVTNPYVVVTVDYAAGDASLGHGNGDHRIHLGPVFDFEADPDKAYPTPRNGDQWGDIIPPYGGFDGVNWTDDGQAVHEAGCARPLPPTTEPPVTEPPTTEPPTTEPPTTEPPVTEPPTTEPPTTEPPTTEPPVTEPPTTEPPTTEPPVTEPPTTEPPTTEPPTTEPPTTEAPTVEPTVLPDQVTIVPEAPDTVAPDTEVPDAEAPETVPEVLAETVVRTELPRTGTGTAWMTVVGVALLLSGSVLLGASRRVAAHTG